MQDFNVTIGNVTASTSMIEEDVIRLRMGLEPKGEETMKNKVEWMDIVKINDEYYLERHDVEFEEKEFDEIYLGNDETSILNNVNSIANKYNFDWDCLYDCSDFFVAVREKYGLDEDDDIETYMFNDIDIPEEFDIAWMGGYINGMNI